MKIKKIYNGVVPNGKILNSESTSQNDTYSCSYINDNVMDKGTILWTNPNPTNDFIEQDITLTTNDCDVFYLYYLMNKNIDYMKVEILVINKKGLLSYPAITGFSDYPFFRWITAISNSKIHFNNAKQIVDGNEQDANTFLVPIYIIGHKTNLFN